MEIFLSIIGSRFAVGPRNIVLRRHTELLLETFCEVAGRRKAHHIAHFAHYRMPLVEKLGSPFQPLHLDIVVGIEVEQTFDFAVKCCAAHPHGGNDIFHRIFRIAEIGLDDLVDTTQEVLINLAQPIPGNLGQ